MGGRVRTPWSGPSWSRTGARSGRASTRRRGCLTPSGTALAACEEDPAGATMYVSLEPCAHEGRTPPCTDAILEAKIARVVVASDDPTPKANGRGLGILRDEGIEVEVVNGAVAAQARLLNQPFRKHALTGRPHVVFKVATTLDGKVATAAGRLEVDLERVEPRPRAPVAGGGRRGRGGDPHGDGRRSAAHVPRRRGCQAADARRVRLRGQPAARLEARRVDRRRPR